MPTVDRRDRRSGVTLRHPAVPRAALTRACRARRRASRPRSPAPSRRRSPAASDFEGVLKELALQLAGIAFDAALQPISNAIGSAIGGLRGSACRGGSAAAEAVRPRRRDRRADAVSARRGTRAGRRGGAEAVLPLARGADGRLGVRGGGGGADGGQRQRDDARRRQLPQIRGAGDGDARPRRRPRAEGALTCRR